MNHLHSLANSYYLYFFAQQSNAGNTIREFFLFKFLKYHHVIDYDQPYSVRSKSFGWANAAWLYVDYQSLKTFC